MLVFFYNWSIRFQNRLRRTYVYVYYYILYDRFLLRRYFSNFFFHSYATAVAVTLYALLSGVCVRDIGRLAPVPRVCRYTHNIIRYVSTNNRVCIIIICVSACELFETRRDRARPAVRRKTRA